VEDIQSQYSDSVYLKKTGGTWHLEDAPFKAHWVLKMLARHPEIQPTSICEIGCGSGGVLAELSKALPEHVALRGYDISPQAHAIAQRFSSPHCEFILGNAFSDDSVYDLVLVMDVVEHVENCFDFLRLSGKKGRMKMYHLPLEANASKILRGICEWDSVGHVHLFSIETAIKTVEYTGHRIVDWLLTDSALGTRQHLFRNHLANLLRRPLGKVSERFCARALGGYSLLILAE
jgi:SAM-dependent methyltransferase